MLIHANTRLIASATIATAVFVGIGFDSTDDLASSSREPEPLRGVLHLKIGNPADKERRNLRLDRPGVLPLKAGDRFWIEVRLNRPAYVYIFWIGSDGMVAPIYPWKPGKWQDRPATEQKRDRLGLPPNPKEAWEIPAGEPGIDTLLLLVREDSPLPRQDEESLAKLLEGSRIPMKTMIKEAVWVENGREITIDRQDRAVPGKKTAQERRSGPGHSRASGGEAAAARRLLPGDRVSRPRREVGIA